MRLLAPCEVARRLNLSGSRVIQLGREGTLPAQRDRAGRRFYDTDEVERFALARERQTGRPGLGSSHA